MEVRIGVRENPRELVFESTETAEKLVARVNAAIADGNPTVTFSDEKGRVLMLPTATIAFLEIGAEESRRVGFIA
jgi:hypothetical protein